MKLLEWLQSLFFLAKKKSIIPLYVSQGISDPNSKTREMVVHVSTPSQDMKVFLYETLQKLWTFLDGAKSKTLYKGAWSMDFKFINLDNWIKSEYFILHKF